jgi:hypothetical protein
MSTFKHPVGPQPNRVYWRRRLLVGLGALVVLIVIVLIVVRPGSSQGEPRAVPTTTATPSGQPTVPPSTSIPTTSSTAKAQACDSSEVTVGAVTDSTSYAAGVFPNLSLSLTNTGSKPCKINAGTAQQVFTISSGSEVYWKSTDCQTNPTNAEVVLQPGKTVTTQTPIVWDRTRSDPATCNATRTQVPAGGASYHLQTSVAGIVSKSTAQFSLN